MGDIAWQAGKAYREIIYETAGGIAKISINRPERRNAFTPLTVTELYDAFSEARDDASVGVIILTGVNHGGRHEDEAFCSGGDQKIRGNGGYVGEDNIPLHRRRDCQVRPDGPEGGQLRRRVRRGLSGEHRGPEEGARDLVSLPPVHGCRGA